MGSTYQKKKDTRIIDHFRPISLPNVQGKIVLGVIAKRMTRLVINNVYVNISIQKAGVSGFPGCIEYTTMLCVRIKKGENTKTELHVI